MAAGCALAAAFLCLIGVITGGFYLARNRLAGGPGQEASPTAVVAIPSLPAAAAPVTLTVPPLASPTPLPASPTRPAPTFTPTSSPATPVRPSSTTPPAPALPPQGSTLSTNTPAPAVVDQYLVEGEHDNLIVHPGFQKYNHPGFDISLNIPTEWQNLGEDHRGYSLTLGLPDGSTTLIVWRDKPGDPLYRRFEECIPYDTIGVLVPIQATTIGHYPARQQAVVAADGWYFMAEVSLPGSRFLLTLHTPVDASDASILFEVITTSFRTPSRCGQAVCPELLRPDEPTPVAIFVPTAIPAPAPTTPLFQPRPDAVNIFFTITLDGTPWGYIVDRQGREIYPEDGILTVQVEVNPDDLIVIQTDATGFSLLFDCGTSPGSFSPCDFAASVPAELPAEIRANPNGSPAYLNISRPNNWAGERPGFAGQRYPADPVLRVVLN